MACLLVCGDATGDAAGVAAKICSLNKKSGPFSAVLFTGGFASTLSDLTNVNLPIPGFFTGQVFNGSDQRVNIPRANVTYVGPAGAERVNGASVMFLAGGYDDPLSDKGPLPLEVRAAMRDCGVDSPGFKGVDVFVCPDIPRGIEDGENPGSAFVARVSSSVRPRYHFASTGKYISLPAFRCEEANHGTRFFGMACASKGKIQKGQKWMYGVRLVASLDAMTPSQLAGTLPSGPSPCLYQANSVRSIGRDSGKRARESERERHQYFWKLEDRPNRARIKRPRVSIETPPDAACWFCLANEKDQHLVVSVGNHVYLALAKGGILPEHVLIVPIQHVRNLLDPRLKDDARAEIEKYKGALRAFFKEKMNSRSYFFERAIRTRGGEAQTHMHIQCVPIGENEYSRASEIANNQAERFRLKLIEPPENESCVAYIEHLARGNENVEYFWAELPDGVKAVQVLKGNRPSPHSSATQKESGPKSEHPNGEGRDHGDLHPLQFGRSIGAALVRRLDRTDWKRCILSREDEKTNAERFKRRFLHYDPFQVPRVPSL